MFSWTKPALYHAQEKGTYVSGLKITTCGNWSNKEDTRLCACGIRRDSKLGKTQSSRPKRTDMDFKKCVLVLNQKKWQCIEPSKQFYILRYNFRIVGQTVRCKAKVLKTITSDCLIFFGHCNAKQSGENESGLQLRVLGGEGNITESQQRWVVK